MERERERERERSGLSSNFCKQTGNRDQMLHCASNLGLHCLPVSKNFQIWVYTVCLNPEIWTLGLYWLGIC